MPAWTVRFLRLALGWLVVGAALGALLLAAKGMRWSLPWGRLLAVHVELLLVGWMLQFALGVAYWMLPRHPTAPERGAAGPVAAAFGLLNLGLVIAAAGAASAAEPPIVALGRLAELAAVVAFAANAWPRIKPFGAGRGQVNLGGSRAGTGAIDA